MIATERPPSLIHNKGLRQLVKFGIVGASSTLVNLGVCNLLLNKVPLLVGLTIAFVLSVCNGFFWNRKWTFKDVRGTSAHEQYMKYFVVNVVGLVLSLTIDVVFIAHFTGHGLLTDSEAFKHIVMVMLQNTGKKEYGRLLVTEAQAVSTCVVVFWNFFVNRFWTFKN